METTEKNLDYYRKNAEENYLTTPISVLRYIWELEAALRQPPVSGRSEQFVCGANRVMGEKRCERQCGQCEELYPQTNCH